MPQEVWPDEPDEGMTETLYDEVYLEIRACNGHKRELFDWADEEDTLFYQIRLSGKYAILSHRWQDEELVFDDLVNMEAASTKKGYEKFIKFCEIAQQYGCRYVWIDTVCINKTSSSELDESIRSMFSWYRNAYVCIIYLTIPAGELRDDLWFTRGWTLQELLAPRRLKFFWGDWTEYEVGTRFDIRRASADLLDIPANRTTREHHYDATLVADYDVSLASTEDEIEAERGNGVSRLADEVEDSKSSRLLQAITEITGIDPDNLLQYNPSPRNARSAFHWVSRRITTRPEDIAYCLIALLDIRIPITYGEGPESAFYVFKWNVPCRRRIEGFSRGLVVHPDGILYPIISDPLFITALSSTTQELYQSFTMTNCGLRIMMVLCDIVFESFYLKSGVFRPARRGARTPLQLDLVFRAIESGDTNTLLGWVGQPPQKDEMEATWKIGILGCASDDKAFAVLLHEVEGRTPTRYRRFTSAVFRQLPPLSQLIADKLPASVFVE
ncbi:hypothetical protein ONZ45_g10225 [Pleurotus djamor]|nr:hypothetical protein ONZ45_g10225 [Pleurotus djamor]